MTLPDKPETKTVIRLWWAWREAEEAAWIQEMSKKGWHLRRAVSLVYVFERGAPANYVYRFDFRPGGRAALAEYLDLCQEAGWQHVSSFGGWHCLRIDADTHSNTELYTDRSGLIAKYKRLLRLLLPALVPIYAGLFIILQHGGEEASPLVWLLLGVIAFFVYAMLRIALIIRRLRA